MFVTTRVAADIFLPIKKIGFPCLENPNPYKLLPLLLR